MKTRLITLLLSFSVGDEQSFFEYLWMKKLFIPDEKKILVSQKTF